MLKVLKKNKFISIVFLSVVIIGSLAGYLLLPKILDQGGSNDTDDQVEGTASQDLQARYVSKYQEGQADLTDVVSLKEVHDTSTDVEMKDDSLESADKLGKLEKNESRKIVHFENDLAEEVKQQLESEYKVQFSNEKSEKGVYTVYINEDSDTEGLEDIPDVQTVETDKPVRLLAQTTDWGIDRIGATKVWTQGSGNGVDVAVIDTGVQVNHSDLSTNVYAGYDFIHGDEVADDENGHGTHVAGIIGAVNNQLGVVGASYSVNIIPVKVLNADGYGYLSDVARGIYYATDNGAEVINLSLGSGYDSVTIKEAIQYAYDKGVVIVAAAGNSGSEGCLYPAAYAEVSCVMATDKDNKLATFSNLGGDFVAPGVSNYSTYVGDRYAYLSGTSMASPHVAGAVALVLSHEKVSSPVEALEVIQTNVVDLGVEGKDSVFGYGLVDLVAAFESLAEEEPESDDVTDSPSEEEGDIDDNEDSKEENNDGDEDDTDKDNNGKDNDKKPLVQHIEITSHDDKRIVLEEGSEEDVTLEFGLDPVSEDSTLDEIVVYIDNDEVYTTKLQEDSYVLENEELGSAQYIIRIEATFENKSKKIVTVLLDTTAFDNREENNKANPGRARNKSILGAATRFQY